MNKFILLATMILIAATTGSEASSRSTNKAKSGSSGEKWTVTAYSSSAACNGKWGPYAADGGSRLKWGMIAADWSVLPPGTRVKIEGFGNQIFVVRDKGRAIKGKKIDLYIPDASGKKLYRFGKRKLRIEVLEKGQTVARKLDPSNDMMLDKFAFLPRSTSSKSN